MKTQIRRFIENYIEGYQKRDHIATHYGKPLTGFADAFHPYIQSLPHLIGRTHELPQNILPDAKIIIAYFIPFTKDLALSNRDGRLSSPEWARAYEETNALFMELNAELIDFIRTNNGNAATAPGAMTFNRKTLVSDWSHRHIAYAAGLGTFGINNMLLTKHGCCGRFSTVITNLELEADVPSDHEYCLNKRNGTCGVCMNHCPANALTIDGFDRSRCYAQCQENATIYTQFGSSYINEDGNGPNSTGSEVCGKCITDSPCAFRAL